MAMQQTVKLPEVNRRALLASAIILVGGTLSGLPDEVFAQTGQKARFLNERHFALLDEITEIMIPRTDTPGARDAGVAAFIDALMLNWASPETRRFLPALLDDLDKASAASAGQSFMNLPPAKRLDVMRRYDAQKLAAADPAYGRFKDLVLTAYYLSEPGATQELRYELVPGKWEATTTITPDTRAWAV